MLWYIFLVLYATCSIETANGDFVTPCNSGEPRNCACSLADASLPWEPVSDACFKGCLHNIDYNEITWQEAMEFCRSKGGELVRWNSQQCYDDIEGWLNCQNYNDSKRFWSSGGADIELDQIGNAKTNKKNWAAIIDGQVKYYGADPTMGDVSVITVESGEDKIILHHKSNGVLVPENQPPQSNKMYICQTFCDSERDVGPPPPLPPPPGGVAGDDPLPPSDYPVDCSLNVLPNPICGNIYTYCYDQNCHLCDKHTNAGCADPLKPMCTLQNDGDFAGQYLCSSGPVLECPVAPATCTCNMVSLTTGLNWDPISDFCFEGCMMKIESTHATWDEAFDSCLTMGGNLVRWNSQECFHDIQSWLRCQGYNDSRRFWSAGGFNMTLDSEGNFQAKDKYWKAMIKQNVGFYKTLSMGNVVLEVHNATADKVVLHFKGNQNLHIANQPPNANLMYICMAPCDPVGPPPPPPPPPPGGGGNDPPQLPPVDCSIIPNCPTHAPYCYEGTCHVCNVTNHDGCNDPNKPFCKLNETTNWLMCGDPHFVESITGSDIPVCYTLFGRAGRHYKLLEYETTIITGIFADSKDLNFAHFLGALTITAGGNTIHFTGLHIKINGVRHEWGAAPSVALEQGNADVIFNNNRQVTFISATSGIEVGVSRRGSRMGSNSRLDLKFTIPKALSGAKGIMGDMKSGTVTTEDNQMGTLTVNGAVADVHIGYVKFGPPGIKCWELDGFKSDIHLKLLADNLHHNVI
ncbi:unnamed protein product [Owenia fusiformis]|uniref:C-type lectin domain-containing protein n=1 Tax=Owenia fusiformis TaxID=6347 RepID=A0A8S4Q0K6_OWEFU|nr:unnamed protein product [Owenia fusiformis]